MARRKFLPYPTLKDLQERRREIQSAENFSRNVVKGVVSARSVRIGDLLRTFKRSKSASQKPSDEKNRDNDTSSTYSGDIPDIAVDNASVQEGSVEATEEVTPEEAEIVRIILRLANSVADLLERVKKCVLTGYASHIAALTVSMLQHLPLAKARGFCAVWSGEPAFCRSGSVAYVGPVC